MDDIVVLVLALAWDALLGELPLAIHPVAWMGKAASALERRAPAHGRALQLVYGAALVLAVVALFTAPAWALVHYLKPQNTLAYLLLAVPLATSTFAARELIAAAHRVRDALGRRDLPLARAGMTSLVSRATAGYDEPRLVGATIESVAENFNDSFVAPLFYFVLLGLPGALAYRALNTLDALIGYHGPYEYLGKVAARADDLLNFIPARLATLLLVAVCPVARGRAGAAWRVVWRDHGRTESPNAGWTMAAMAGALGTRLEKEGQYELGDPGAALEPALITRATLIVLWGMGAAALLAMAALGVRYGYFA
ncbi:MAG: cobalamin biosynthesis protein CobD [Dehalococcoidia bacterium]|nr:cobalamin biosynthesis protein CobD [Dehalococcoidia bacterium]